MRKLICSFCLLVLSLPLSLQAQTFTTQYDTTWTTFYGQWGVEVHNDLIVPVGGAPITLHWKVISENFSADPGWCGNPNLGICDNNLCISNGGGNLLGGTLYSSSPQFYTHGGNNTFKGNFGLYGSNPGHHYITINLRDSATGDNKNITFMVYKWPTSTASVTKNIDNVSLYPNPANDELNVVYNELEVKNIVVYNIIGKTVGVYHTSGTGAKLDLSRISAGVYFLRMSDAKGDIVATRKFTRQ